MRLSMISRIHPTALIDSTAKLAEDVKIGPFAVVEGEAIIGAGCRLAAHAIVRCYSILEAGVSVDSFAVVGGLPQDLNFDPGTRSRVRIGEGTVLREGVTVHRSTRADGETVVGARCLLMANAHVAHDCQIGSSVIVANNAMLAGHIWVGDGAFLGGGCGIHQFVSIGERVMVAGNASVTYDVPPFVTVAERSLVTGLNLVGLKRHLPAEAIADLRACYKAVYMRPGNPAKLAVGIVAATEEGRRFLAALTGPTRRGRFSLSRAQGSAGLLRGTASA